MVSLAMLSFKLPSQVKLVYPVDPHSVLAFFPVPVILVQSPISYMCGGQRECFS